MKKVCGFLPRGSTASAEAAKDTSPAVVSEKRMLEISKLGIDHEKKGSIIVRFARKVRIKNGKPPGQRKNDSHTHDARRSTAEGAVVVVVMPSRTRDGKKWRFDGGHCGGEGSGSHHMEFRAGPHRKEFIMSNLKTPA